MLSATSFLFLLIGNLTLTMVSDSGVTAMNRRPQRRVSEPKCAASNSHQHFYVSHHKAYVEDIHVH
jgi:hypothetical protein